MITDIKRNDAIDIIRGYFLFVIIIDHLYRFFGFYDLFTGGGRQWVSAAEGFFFVSGMMIGLVRGRKLLNKPLKESCKKILSRAAVLYIWSVGLTFFFTIIGTLYVDNPGVKSGLFYNEPISKLIIHTLTLRFTYGWADFLVYYVIYLLLSPIAIWLLRIGKWYILGAISFLVWLLLGKNVQLTWHLLFFWGAIAGFYLPEIELWFKQLPGVVKHTVSASIISLMAITVSISLFFNTIVNILYRNQSLPRLGIDVYSLQEYNTNVLAPIFDKYTLAYGRLILFLIWFGALYILVRKFEKPLTRTLGKFFIPLGQNSLYVYIVHAVIVYIINLLIPNKSTPVLLNILLNTIVLFTIWLMVKKEVFFKIIPR